MTITSVGKVDDQISVGFTKQPLRVCLLVTISRDAVFYFRLGVGAHALASRLFELVTDRSSEALVEEPDLQVRASIMDDQRIALSFQVHDAAQVRVTLTRFETQRLADLLLAAMVKGDVIPQSTADALRRLTELLSRNN
jgi:hypothetical protein